MNPAAPPLAPGARARASPPDRTGAASLPCRGSFCRETKPKATNRDPAGRRAPHRAEPAAAGLIPAEPSPMGDPGGLRWGGRKVCLAVAIAELAIILILATGLGHFVATERWLHSRVLALRGELAGANWTLQETQEGWELCKNHTHVLQKNVTDLIQEVSRLNGAIAQEEVEKGRLRDEISAWKNTAQHLQEQKDQYHREVTWLQQQLQRHQDLRSSVGRARLPGLLPLLVAPLVALLV